MSAGPSRAAGHVVLVGMMGVGKSTVGRRLASALELPFVDSDDELVARTGRTVAEIFAADGEPAFRVLEAEVMADLLASDRATVIAAAGGAVLAPATRAWLRERSTVVWLRAPVDVLVERTSGGTHRPALADDPRATLERMEDDRSAVYAEVADVVIDADRPVAAVVDAIVVALRSVVTS